jgi:acyl-phosphate glycerol 3-phosphate acyltransferase
MLSALAIWLGAYLIGALPFGYLLARARGVDIFKAGSGNIGATNVGRVLGKKFGILAFVLDFLKGAIPVAAAMALKPEVPELGAGGWLEVGAGAAAFLGHLFPVYLGFRGGKGVATGAGAAVVLVPGPALWAALAWVTVVAVTNYISLASLAAVTVLVGVSFAAGDKLGDARLLFCVLAGALVFVKHHANIVRLLDGTENKAGWGTFVRKPLHVLALGLWFGSAVFFSLVVAPTLFETFEGLGKSADRPAWFPLPASFAQAVGDIDGPREQGSRAFGYVVGPLFQWYFLVSGVCGFVAAWTALAWSRENPGKKVHRWRTMLLLLAFATVVIGWPLEHKVAELRELRNHGTDVVLGGDADTAAVEKMRALRSEFGAWHLVSLMLNFATILLVTGGMALASQLPGESPALPARDKPPLGH